MVKNSYLKCVDQKYDYSTPIYHGKLEAVVLALDFVKYLFLGMTYIHGTDLVWVFALVAIIFKILAFLVVRNNYQSTFCNPLNIFFDFLVLAVGLSAGAKLDSLGAGWVVAFMLILALFMIFMAVVFFGVFFSKSLHLLLILIALLYFIIAWCMEFALNRSSSPS